MKKEWVISIRNQCEMAGVAFYFKQWGGTRKHLNGRVLDGRIYDAMPVAADRPSATGLLALNHSVALRD